MTSPILLAVAFVGTAIGTYTDLKTKLVPDFTNHFMLFTGLCGYAIISLLQWSVWPLVWSLVGAGIFFGIGYVLSAAGVWGGGDAKLLAAFGALFGPVKAVAIWPFLVSLWLNIFIFGAVFGLLGTLIILTKNRAAAMPALKTEFGKNKLLVSAALGAFAITAFLSFSSIIFSLIALIFVLLLLLFVFKATEAVCMIKKLTPSKLVEGDWVVEPITIGAYKYLPKKSGIEKQDIAKLIEFERAGKLKDVKIKDGIPYVPAFLAALIVTLAYGDIFYKIMLGLV